MLRMEQEVKSRHWNICVSQQINTLELPDFSMVLDSLFHVAEPQVPNLIQPSLDGRTLRVPWIERAVAISCDALRYQV